MIYTDVTFFDRNQGRPGAGRSTDSRGPLVGRRAGRYRPRRIPAGPDARAGHRRGPLPAARRAEGRPMAIGWRGRSSDRPGPFTQAQRDGIRRILTEAHAAEAANGWANVATGDGGRMTIYIKYLDVRTGLRYPEHPRRRVDPGDQWPGLQADARVRSHVLADGLRRECGSRPGDRLRLAEGRGGRVRRRRCTSCLPAVPITGGAEQPKHRRNHRSGWVARSSVQPNHFAGKRLDARSAIPVARREWQSGTRQHIRPTSPGCVGLIDRSAQARPVARVIVRRSSPTAAGAGLMNPRACRPLVRP